MNSIIVSDWKIFARETIRINDLDPTYSMLVKARDLYGDEWAARFCLHMLMFYHVGEASFAAQLDGREFWEYVEDSYPTCKRGTERRHFRGEAGRASIASLKSKFLTTPGNALRAFHRPTYPEFHRAVQNGATGFGDYFIWKWADYLHCVFEQPIDLSEAYKYMPSEPAKCAKAFWPELTLKQSLDRVVDEIKQYSDPFTNSRPCGVSEAETILCMMKGFFITKSHRLGDDLLDKHKALVGTTLGELLPPVQNLDQWIRP
jgi:hypothetical protein